MDSEHQSFMSMHFTIFDMLNITSFRMLLPYKYWELNSLFIEQTIYLEKVKDKQRELEQISVIMMETKSGEAIKEYNNTKMLLKQTENTLFDIETAINGMIR